MTESTPAGDSTPVVAVVLTHAADPRGRDAAFAEMHAAHHHFVWSTLARLGVPRTVLEDAVQDVFMTAYKRMADFEARSSTRTWLYGIARKIAFRHRRSAQRLARKLEAISAEPEPPRSLSAQIDARAALRLLDRCLERLDAGQREVFVLAELQGLSGPEVAAATQLPLNTAYARLRLARARIDRDVRVLCGVDGRPTYDEILQRACVANNAPSHAQARSWSVLTVEIAALEQVAGSWLASVAERLLHTCKPWFATAKGVLGGALGGGAIVAVASFATSHPDPSTREPATPEASADRAEPTADPATRPPAAPSIAGPRRDLDRAAPAEESRALPPPSAPRRSTQDTRGEGLEHERALIDAARRAESTTAALRSLDEHASRFPDGALAIDRDAERIVVLCHAGRMIQGRGEASTFLAANPSSGHAARIRSSCRL